MAVVISPNIKKESVRIDPTGNVINPRTKQIITPVQEEYVPPVIQPVVQPVEVKTETKSVSKMDDMINKLVEKKVEEMVAKKVEEALANL